MHVHTCWVILCLSFTLPFPVASVPVQGLISHLYLKSKTLKALLNFHVDLCASQSRPEFVLKPLRKWKVQKGSVSTERRLLFLGVNLNFGSFLLWSVIRKWPFPESKTKEVKKTNELRRINWSCVLQVDIIHLAFLFMFLHWYISFWFNKFLILWGFFFKILKCLWRTARSKVLFPV